MSSLTKKDNLAKKAKLKTYIIAYYHWQVLKNICKNSFKIIMLKLI